MGPATVAGVNVGAAKTEDVFEETVVTASKGAQSPLDAPNSTSIITEQDIRLSGLIQIPDLLRRLAGVDVMEVTNSQTEVVDARVQPAPSNKVLVLINGRSVYVDLLGATFWATLPIGVEDIERIEVVRGPGSALYGADAFNGVINIITKAPGEGKSGFSVAYGDHNLAHGSMSATGRDKEIAYRLSAGFDYYPRWSSAVASGRVDEQTAPANFPNQQTSQASVRMNADITRDMGRGVTAALGAGYTHSQIEFGPYPPLTDIDFAADTVDATAFITSKHFELHGFYNTYRGQNTLDAGYIGQSLLASNFNFNIADVEAQYVDDEHVKFIDNSLHLGAGLQVQGGEPRIPPGRQHRRELGVRVPPRRVRLREADGAKEAVCAHRRSSRRLRAVPREDRPFTEGIGPHPPERPLHDPRDRGDGLPDPDVPRGVRRTSRSSSRPRAGRSIRSAPTRWRGPSS